MFSVGPRLQLMYCVDKILIRCGGVGKLGEDFPEFRSITINKPQGMFLHFTFVSHLGLNELEFEILKESMELVGLRGVELWCSVASVGGHQMYYWLQHCGIWVGKCQLIVQIIQSGW